MGLGNMSVEYRWATCVAKPRREATVEVKDDFGWLSLDLAPFKWRIALGLVSMSFADITVAIDSCACRSVLFHSTPTALEPVHKLRMHQDSPVRG